MSSGNLLYASDKAIFDALNQHKFTNADLKQLFISRGILVSHETKRNDLATYFSRLNHDYYDHQEIASVLGVAHRKEKSSITSINNTFEAEAIENAALAVKKEQEKCGDIVETRSTNKGIEITLRYSEIDYNKSEFRQVIQKEAIVTIEADDNGIAIRWPLNDRSEEVKERFIDHLGNSDDFDDDLDIQEIELTNIETPKLRTDFFDHLIRHISDYKLYDVTDVYVYNPKESVDSDEEDEIGVHIAKASLKGEGVLNSQVLNDLYDEGFYIWKIIWTAKTNHTDSDIYEFEAQFSNPEECKNFSYLIRGMYKYKSFDEYNKGKTSISHLEEIKLSRKIESAAKASLKKIVSEFNAD